MRTELRWTLGGTLLLSVAALWWPQSGPKVVGAEEHPTGDAAHASANSPDYAQLKAPLPPTLDPQPIEPARRDPFVAMPPAPAVVAAAPRPTPQPAPPPIAPAVPTAPPLTLRYLGRMVTPDGRPMVLLARGDTAVTVQAGMMLDEGYRVLRISPEAVRLVYPPTGGEVDIPIPPAPHTP